MQLLDAAFKSCVDFGVLASRFLKGTCMLRVLHVHHLGGEACRDEPLEATVLQLTAVMLESPTLT
jgi:hypothetical protein